jgi:hypothetical protein
VLHYGRAAGIEGPTWVMATYKIADCTRYIPYPHYNCHCPWWSAAAHQLSREGRSGQERKEEQRGGVTCDRSRHTKQRRNEWRVNRCSHAAATALLQEASPISIAQMNKVISVLQDNMPRTMPGPYTNPAAALRHSSGTHAV